MNVIQQTAVFASWLGALDDVKAKARVVARIEAAKLGNFGDWEAVGDGVCEMRIHFGPGYRVHFMREGAVVYVLLCGGDKSTQQSDIARARKMAIQLKQAAKKAKEPAAGADQAKAKPKAKAKSRKG